MRSYFPKFLCTARGLVGAAALAGLLLTCSTTGSAQVNLKTVSPASVTTEPSGGAAQGVFDLSIQDVDVINNDTSGVIVQCVLVQNLGTATASDVPFITLQGVGVQTPSSKATATPPVAPPANCPEGSAPNSNVAFEVFFSQAELDAAGFGGSPFDVADDGSLSVQLAVRVGTSAALGNGAQNHTLKLRFSIQFQETVGSPPVLTSFTNSLTDGAEDLVFNGGINRFEGLSFPANTIRIGQTGEVARFRICDGDANNLPLKITRIRLVQGTNGDALNSDIERLDLKAVGLPGTPGTVMPATDVKGTDFNRGGVGLNMPVSSTVGDDGCQEYQLLATIAATAQRGRKIHLNLTVFAEEGTAIDTSAAPSFQVPAIVLIGSGILSIPDTAISGSQIELKVEGFPLPGLGRLDVQTQAVQFDPRVVNVASITAQPPYQLQSFSADNRAGLLRFSLVIDPSQTPSAKTEGTIAVINLTKTGLPGQSTLFLLVVDSVLDANGANVTSGIVTASGSVRLLVPGDVDFDERPTVRDALIVATAIMPCINGAPISDLTDDQKESADVAPSQAPPGQVPTCVELNSADVRGISQLAITFGITSAPGPIAAVAPQPGKPWWQRALDWALGRPQPARAALHAAPQSLTLSVEGARAVGALQGVVRYDPAQAKVEAVTGLNGVVVTAYEIDNARGEVRFVALAPGVGAPSGALLQLRWSTQGEARPQLALEYLLNPGGGAIPFVSAPPSDAQPFAVDALQLRPNGVGWTLEVVGRGVGATQVRVFDLAGRLVLEAESNGGLLRWQMLGAGGRPLANGVYLYVVSVRGPQGQVWRGAVGKLIQWR